MTPNVIVCINLLDEAKKKSIKVDLSLLSEILGVPVVGTIANKPKTLKALLSTISENVSSRNTCDRYLVKYSDKVESFISKIEDLIRPSSFR